MRKDAAIGSYLRGANLIRRESGVETEYYLFNAHGDVVRLTDDRGNITGSYDYDAFGNEKNPDSADYNPFRYYGEYLDSETGTYYLRARYYDPAIGRFTQMDSVRQLVRKLPNGADIADPLSLNLYTYCHNNPILCQDQGGHSPAIAAAFQGAIPWLSAAGTALAPAVPTIVAVGALAFGAVFAINYIAGKIESYVATAENTKSWIREQVKAGGLDSKNLRDHSVYIIIENSQFEVVYVGRTANFFARQYAHQSSGRGKYPVNRFTMMPIATGMTLMEARALEETLIAAYTVDACGKMAITGIENRIHSIAFRNWDRFAYEFWRIQSLISGLWTERNG